MLFIPIVYCLNAERTMKVISFSFYICLGVIVHKSAAASSSSYHQEYLISVSWDGCCRGCECDVNENHY